MGTCALVSSLPGCVVPGFGEAQQRSFRSTTNWVPKARVRVSVSASSSSQGEPDSRAEDGEPRIGDAGAGSQNPRLDSLLSPRKKQSSSADEIKPKGNAAQPALERAMAYKKMKGLGASANPTLTQPQTKPSPPVRPNPVKVEILAGKPIQSSRSSTEPSNSDAARSSEEKLGSEKEEAGSTVALSAFERAQAYKRQQSEMIAALIEKPAPEASTPEVEKEENVVEIEIHTREGIVRRKVLKLETAFANVKDIKRKGVSTIDFVGLGFADKKSASSRPAGLSESFEAPTGMSTLINISSLHRLHRFFFTGNLL